MFTKKEAKELQDKFKTYSLPEIIEKHKLNKAHLARLMGMPVGTFKNKVLQNVQPYHLTDQESIKLFGILMEFCEDMGRVVIEHQTPLKSRDAISKSKSELPTRGAQQTYKKP